MHNRAILKKHFAGCSVILKFAIIHLLLFSSARIFGQEGAKRGANYALASRFTPDKIDKMVFDVAVEPHWLKFSERFWYRYETSEKTSFFIVDPEKKTKEPLFDNQKMASALTGFTMMTYDPNQIPIEKQTLDPGPWWEPAFSDKRTPRFSDTLSTILKPPRWPWLIHSRAPHSCRDGRRGLRTAPLLSLPKITTCTL
jgi:hypothetical protein